MGISINSRVRQPDNYELPPQLYRCRSVAIGSIAIFGGRCPNGRMADPMLRILAAACGLLIVILFALWFAPESFFATPIQHAGEHPRQPQVYTRSTKGGS